MHSSCAGRPWTASGEASTGPSASDQFEFPGRFARSAARHTTRALQSVREALRALATQGLLEHRPHQGYFVIKRTQAELDDLEWMLSVLERELINTLAWPRRAVLNRLRALDREMRRVAESDEWLPLLVLNREIHLTIFGLSRRRLVLQQVERLWLLAEPYQMSLADPQVRGRTVEQHEAILDTLADQDRAAAVQALDHHRASMREGAAPLPLPSAGRAAVAERPG